MPPIGPHRPAFDPTVEACWLQAFGDHSEQRVADQHAAISGKEVCLTMGIRLTTMYEGQRLEHCTVLQYMHW